MDNNTPPQVPDSPVPAELAQQQPAYETPPEEHNKPKSKKKIIILLVVLLLAIGLGAAAFFLLRSEPAVPTATNATTQESPAKPSPKPTKLWLTSYYNKTDQFAEISYDGSEITSVKQPYTPAVSSKYIALVTDKGVEVASSSKPEETVLVLEKKAGESVDFAWYDDADELIVSTKLIANKPAKPDQYYIPDVRQSFYKVNPDGSGKSKLFDQQTTYGSAFIIGASDKRQEFYWGVETEGGPAALLNVSSLETGKLVKKLNPKANDSGKITILGDNAYYISTADTIRNINLDTYKDTLVANPLGDTAGISTTALTATCSVGGSIESLIKVHDSADTLLFSTVTNKPHKSGIYQLNLKTKKYASLTGFDSVRQIKLLASTEEKVIFSRNDANICNAKNEKSAPGSISVFDQTTKKNTEVELDSSEKYINASVNFFAKPAN